MGSSRAAGLVLLVPLLAEAEPAQPVLEQDPAFAAEQAFPPYELIFGPDDTLDALSGASAPPLTFETACAPQPDPDRRRRARAILRLDASKRPDNECLARVAYDLDERMRAAAAFAMSRLGTSEALPLLRRLLDADKSWWVRHAAASGLGRVRDPESVVALCRALRFDNRWSVRLQAARSLGEIGGPEAIPALGAALEDPDLGVRAAATLSLGKVGGPAALSPLRSALARERDPYQRRFLDDAVARMMKEP